VIIIAACSGIVYYFCEVWWL